MSDIYKWDSSKHSKRIILLKMFLFFLIGYNVVAYIKKKSLSTKKNIRCKLSLTINYRSIYI